MAAFCYPNQTMDLGRTANTTIRRQWDEFVGKLLTVFQNLFQMYIISFSCSTTRATSEIERSFVKRTNQAIILRTTDYHFMKDDAVLGIMK